MSEATASVKWRKSGLDDGFYTGNGFIVCLCGTNWWVHEGGYLVKNVYAADHPTAKQQAERWILERVQ